MTRDTDLISRALVKHNRDLLLDQSRKAMPCSGEDEVLDHGARMYRAGIKDLARRLMMAPSASQPEAEPVARRDEARDAYYRANLHKGPGGGLWLNSTYISAFNAGWDARAKSPTRVPAAQEPEPVAQASSAVENLIALIGQYGLFMGEAWRVGEGAEIMDAYQAAYEEFTTPAPVVPAEELDALVTRLLDGPSRIYRDIDADKAAARAITALRSAPPVGARVIAEKAYLAGFNAAGEGYNGEWPFHDKGISPDTDEGWLIGRDMALAALLPAGEGE